MRENKKPEWIALADAEGKPDLRKVSPSLPISAVLVTTLIIGVGAVIAQTQNETPASAVTANATEAPTAMASPATNTLSGVVAGAATAIANPSITQLPKDGEDDDDYGRDHHENYDDEDYYDEGEED